MDLSYIFAKWSQVSTIRIQRRHGKMCLACDTIVPTNHGHKEKKDLLTHVFGVFSYSVPNEDWSEACQLHIVQYIPPLGSLRIHYRQHDKKDCSNKTSQIDFNEKTLILLLHQN